MRNISALQRSHRMPSSAAFDVRVVATMDDDGVAAFGGGAEESGMRAIIEKEPVHLAIG
jgi:hypothetical protein